MPRVTGRRVAAILGALGALALGGVVWAAWPYFVESWCIRRLESPDALVRADAARRLGEMRSVRAVPALVDSLERAWKLEIEDISGPYSPYVVSWAELAAQAETRALIAIGEPGAEILASRLDTMALRDEIVEILAHMEPSPIAVFGGLLESADIDVRVRALSFIDGCGEEVDGIVPFLARALERVDDPRALRVDQGDVASELASHRLALLEELLSRTSDADLVRPTLETLLDDPDFDLRIAAAEHLGKVGDDASASHLAAALEKATESALEKRSAADTPDTNQLWRVAIATAWSLRDLGRSAQAEDVSLDLIDALRADPDAVDASASQRASILSVLALIATDDGLVRSLASNDAHVRRLAARTIEMRWSSPARVLAALIACLDDADDEVRSAAANALVSETNGWPSDDEPRLVAATTRALATGGRHTRYWSARLLGVLAERHSTARDALQATRDDADERVRRAAAEALSALAR